MSAAFDIAMKMMRQAAQDAEKGDVKEWITLSGQPVPVKEGQTRKEAGQQFAAWNSETMQATRRDKVEDAMREIANGSEEATIPGLRNDLEQYGGTNDVTIVKGDSKKGLDHIAERHGQSIIPFVLEAVANGEIVKFVEGNKTVHIEKDGYRAVLALEEHGKKKSWLLTGFEVVESQDGKERLTGDSGKVSARHASTHTGPILSRPGMGAEAAFRNRIQNIPGNVKPIALDRALVPMAFDRASVRTMDENGFMHIAASHITKATVNPYRGCEIPGWEEKGLDPEKIYRGLRDPEELQKSLPTWAGLPLHLEHHIDSAEKPQKLTRVGLYGAEEFGHCFHLFHIKENMSSMQGDVTVGNFVFPSTTAPETHVVAAGTGEPLLLQ